MSAIATDNGVLHDRASIPARPRLSLERGAIMIVTALWIIGALAPILSLVAISFLRAKGLSFDFSLTLQAYRDILVDFRIEIVLRTLCVVAFVTVIEFLLGYPFALWLAKGLRPGWTKSILLVLLVVPFFLSPAARTIVWRSVLGYDGLVNNMLLASGLVHSPVEWLLFSEFSVHLGLIGPYFPSMVWPLFISISLIDDELIKASRDLGATGLQTLWHVVTPLAAPGIIAGVLFTAVPMLGDNVASTLLGGGRVALIAESFDGLISAMNFTGAAALAALLVFMVFLMILGIWLVMKWLGYSNQSLKAMSS